MAALLTTCYPTSLLVRVSYRKTRALILFSAPVACGRGDIGIDGVERDWVEACAGCVTVKKISYSIALPSRLTEYMEILEAKSQRGIFGARNQHTRENYAPNLSP